MDNVVLCSGPVPSVPRAPLLMLIGADAHDKRAFAAASRQRSFGPHDRWYAGLGGCCLNCSWVNESQGPPGRLPAAVGISTVAAIANVAQRLAQWPIAETDRN